jgi:hypothetical protein
MECCSSAQKPPSRAEFLAQKLKNFQAYLEPLCSSDAQKAKVKEYATVDAAMPFLLQALALRSAGGLDSAIETFTAEEWKVDDVAAFKAKVGRYINMFCDVLST